MERKQAIELGVTAVAVLAVVKITEKLVEHFTKSDKNGNPKASSETAETNGTTTHSGGSSSSTADPSATFTPRIAISGSICDIVGNTPLIELKELSAFLGVRVLGKCEFMNPGGSVKDRVALHILRTVFDSDGHAKYPAGLYEGTSGSTGISLALLAHDFKIPCTIFLPDDTSQEKIRILRAAGAELRLCPPVAFFSPHHYCQQAKAAAEHEGGYYCDQFENPLNWEAHYASTGPEIWEQLKDSKKTINFVAGSGTGGTLCGTGRFLKEKAPNTRVFLADPPGSSLFRYVTAGIAFNNKDKEGHRTQKIFDTVVEGIGLNRVTSNLKHAKEKGIFSGAFEVTDAEAVNMAHFLLYREGLFCGSSSGVNLAACVKLARTMTREEKENAILVTIFCDRGDRHLSKFWCPEVLAKNRCLPADYYTYDLKVDRSKLEHVDWMSKIESSSPL